MKILWKRLLIATLAMAAMLPLAACTHPAGDTDTADTHTTEPEATTAATTVVATMVAETEEPEALEYDPDFRVTAYVCLEADPNNFKFDVTHIPHVTDLIFIGSTARFDTEGNVTVEDSALACIDKARAAIGDSPIRLHINLNGPSSSAPADTWEEQMDNVAKEWRKAFAGNTLEKNIKKTLETYDLDGVFFDWEYPIMETHKKWFGDFLIDLDAVLGDDYVIGCALADWCSNFAQEAIDVMDMVELMSYDLWDENGLHATTELAKKHVQNLLAQGYSSAQIDLGIPFYARPTTGEAFWYGYNGFHDKLDEDGLYHEENTGLKHSFNTPAVVYEKTEWCIENNVGGVMAWHYACDVPGDGEYSLFAAIQRAKDDAGVK